MTNSIQTQNPFSAPKTTSQTSTSGALVDVEAERAIAEVQAQVLMAKRFPRDPAQAMDKILQACTRPTLAVQAIYSYPRGGQMVTGPSIRLAEAIAQNWCNIDFGIRELEQRGAESTVEAFAWDLETNVRQSRVFQVKHVRHTNRGDKRLTDPRDIYELTANQGSRRMRAVILSIIPGDVVDASMTQCEVTQANNTPVTKETISATIEAFAAFGVTPEHLSERLGHDFTEAATISAELISLRKIYASLKDGMSKPAQWFKGFSEPQSTSTPDDVRQQAKRTSAAPSAAAKPSTTKKKSPEAHGPATEADPTPEQEDLFTSLMTAAKTEKSKDGQKDIASLANGLTDAMRERVIAAMSGEGKRQ